MSVIDLNALSPRQLDALIEGARARKAQIRKRKPIEAVRRKAEAMLKAEGYTFAELFGAKGGAAVRTGKTAPRKSSAGRKIGKVPPKYRNPANKDETWTGRGNQPRWLAAQVAKGKKPEHFLIKR